MDAVSSNQGMFPKLEDTGLGTGTTHERVMIPTGNMFRTEQDRVMLRRGPVDTPTVPEDFCLGKPCSKRKCVGR
jgi:hypothetical protein